MFIPRLLSSIHPLPTKDQQCGVAGSANRNQSTSTSKMLESIQERQREAGVERLINECNSSLSLRALPVSPPMQEHSPGVMATNAIEGRRGRGR